MIRNWLRSHCPEAFFTGSLFLFELFSLFFSIYLMTGGIFQGILESFPFFLTGGGIALLLFRFIREPEKHSMLFPLALTASACVPGLLVLLSSAGPLYGAGIILLAGFGIFLPGVVLFSLYGSRVLRSMAWGVLFAAPVWFFFPGECWCTGIVILILASFGLKRQFRCLLPFFAVLIFCFIPGNGKPKFPQETISREQAELTELVLSLQHREPWKNPCFIPAPPASTFLQKCTQRSGRQEKGAHDLVYVFPCLSGPASDVMFRTLSPDGLRALRERLAPSGVLAITLPELKFLPEKEADRFRSRVFAEAGRIFPYVYCTKPPLRLLIASEDSEITLDGSLLSERLETVPQRSGRVESPYEVLDVVLPLLAQEKTDLPWAPEAVQTIRRKFLENKVLIFPQLPRNMLSFRYWVFGGFLLLAFLIRYLSAFHSEQRMAAGCFRSGWIAALPFSYLLFTGKMNFGLFLSAGLALFFFFAVLPVPMKKYKSRFLISVQLLILLFLMLFPEQQTLCFFLLLPAAYTARITIPEGTGRTGLFPWFAGVFFCCILCRMLLPAGCDRIAQGLLLLSLFLP